jgi:malonyl-CoA/methylmalonyl-CoA synthetase
MGTIRPDRGLGEDLSGGNHVPETKSSQGWRAHLPEGVDPERLDLLAAGRLAGFKRPRVVHFVEALPRNALGKVMKHELRP